MRARADRAGDAGFTLLETLVALAILGVVLSTVYGVIGSGLRSAHRDEDRLLLGLVAQNLLARSRFDLNPAGGALSGDIGGGLRWRIESEPYAVPKDILPEAPPELDKPRLPPREEGRGLAQASGGLGTRAASAGEAGGFSQGDRGEAGVATSQDGLSTQAADAGRQEKKEPLRLRLVRVVVEKGDQRYELSSLVMEAPRARPGAS